MKEKSSQKRVNPKLIIACEVPEPQLQSITRDNPQETQSPLIRSPPLEQ